MASVHQRYRIIEKIDAGGMAEIYKGVAVSIEGFEKPVAIKRVLPSLCQNQKFVTMFLDEARLSMQLNHVNIVQIFDIGRADDTYFVAMEMVDGSNLRRIMQRSIDRGQPFPIEIACYLAMEVAKALAYAHEKSDANNQPLGIVHRDVSPPNVLISHNGEVKLTDFGLARAASNLAITDAGVVKGKFAYLSPEAVGGKSIDARADIYSVGIMLWELLCARRLFVGKNDLDTIELVRAGAVPKPSTLRLDVDSELDKIVLRALAKNIKRRYQSARELEQELAAYLFKHNKRVTGSDLATFMRGLVAEGQDVQLVDVASVLRAEMVELGRVGRLDLTVGQVPLRPDDLKARSVSKLGASALLDRLQDVPLDDIAETAAHGTSLADRLERHADKSHASGTRVAPAAPAGKGRRIVGIAVMVGAAVVIGAASLWFFWFR
ncbi:MAG: serine/threonine protein kinase [Myxococcales bacterium]|nr:serine/threonine protein kinase [Myxococcales bacterium]